METPACAVGRFGPEGPWIGFAPNGDGAYALVAGSDGESARSAADARDLVALAIAYFEDSLDEPPEELAATHADIGAIVRSAADRVGDPGLRRIYAESLDAIDDGLAADVVIERLSRIFGDEGDALAHLRRRVTELCGSA